MTDLTSRLRLTPGAPVDLDAIPTGAHPGVHDKGEGRTGLAFAQERLDALQTRLYAEARGGSPRRLLLVLQGMDTSGKGGAIKRVGGAMNPSGLRVVGFGAPTPEELSEHFLARIRRGIPPAGAVGIFDRSHYEDVLVPRVERLVPEEVWRGRYDEINAFEAELAEGGTTLVKVFLHLGYDEQRERLLARLDDPDKHWKFHPSDIAARRRFGDYLEAYAGVLQRCSTEDAPWYVVPADSKWYSRYAVATLVAEALERMDPHLPRPHLDVPALKAALQPPC
jgi:PPK2 family polyphosphate:nucleotide phosphotransferase